MVKCMKLINVYLDDIRTPMNGKVGDTFWVVVRTIEATKTLLEAGVVGNMSLDHNLGPGETGYDLVKWMEAENVWPGGSIAVHSGNIVGRENMMAVLVRNGR